MSVSERIHSIKLTISHPVKAFNSPSRSMPTTQFQGTPHQETNRRKKKKETKQEDYYATTEHTVITEKHQWKTTVRFSWQWSITQYFSAQSAVSAGDSHIRKQIWTAWMHYDYNLQCTSSKAYFRIWKVRNQHIYSNAIIACIMI